jgi:hypothetical protein
MAEMNASSPNGGISARYSAGLESEFDGKRKRDEQRELFSRATAEPVETKLDPTRAAVTIFGGKPQRSLCDSVGFRSQHSWNISRKATIVEQFAISVAALPEP